jgi:hypothetical protein
MFMFHLDKSFRFEFKRIFVNFFITMDNRHWNPERTSFGKEVFLSTGTENAIFQTESERPY